MQWFNDNFRVVDFIAVVIGSMGIVLSFVSIILAYSIFVRNQKNYYSRYLKLLKNKQKGFLRKTRHWNINEDAAVAYLMKDVKFFTEDFLINFTADGVLKYEQYQMLKTIYKHIQKRFIMAIKISYRAIKRGYKNIDIRVQIFGKFNELNRDVFNNKIKNPAFKATNENVYVSRLFSYNHESSTFDLMPRKKPKFYSMGSDFEFKKNIWFIFSSSNKIDKTLEGEDLEKTYYFIACSYTNFAEKHHKKADDKVLEKRERILEKREKETKKKVVK